MFRLTCGLMVLGLLRVFVLTAVGVVEGYRRSSDRIVPWREVSRQTVGWLLPVGRLWRSRPLHGLTSVLFHAGLLLVPLFLAAHLLLWRRGLGFAWPAIPGQLADYLTLTTIATGVGLFLSRVFHRGSRDLSRFQDYVWPLLLIVPFVTGYVGSHAAIGPAGYQGMMLVHIYSADLIMLLIPFTKIAHCILAPMSQVVTAVSWKFVPGAGERVAATLGRGPLTVSEATRVAGGQIAAAEEKGKGVCVK
jgi:nitrate reductase gamma subunit